MRKKASHLHKKTLGQGLVEFAIALPILLLLLLGIIEFGRLLQAWLAVQNAARFGLRYLVTGEYNPEYCEEATAALALTAADTWNGDPANDCFVPDDYSNDARDLTDALVDWARLPSSRDTAKVGATGIGLDDSVPISGSYIDFLTTHNLANIGNPALIRYFHTTVCSSRDANQDHIPDYAWDNTTAIPTCYDLVDDYYMDDPGGPGDRVRIVVTYMHPMIAPFLSNLWPRVPLTAWREGIVERFRTSRVSGIGSQIINAPTRTSTATITPTDTPTETHTPTATPTSSPTPTATPDCSLYTLSSYSFANGASHPEYAQLQIDLLNNAVDPVYLNRLIIDWDFAEDMADMLGYRQMYLDWINYGASTRMWGGFNEGATPNDYASWTDTSVDSPSSWNGPLLLNNGTHRIKFDLDNNWNTFETDGYVVPNDFGMTAYLSNGCIIQRPPAPRPLPQPNCNNYTMTDFTFGDYGNMQMTVRNGDTFGTNVTAITLEWPYLEQLLSMQGDNSTRSDWFSFAQSGTTYVWGNGNGNQTDYDSPTDTRLDAPTTWTGPLAYDPGRTYIYSLDFDKDSETPANWLQQLGVLSSDFGVTFDFENGCQLRRTPVSRPMVTPTPNCTLLTAPEARINGDNFEIRVNNANYSPVYLTYSTMNWPTNWSPGVMYFNYFEFRSNRYYDPAPIYTSPVSSSAPNIALPGNTTSWWIADFDNWPAISTGGTFRGELTFNVNGANCVVSQEIYIVPTPTATATATRPTSTATSTYTNTPIYSATPTNTATLIPSNTPTSTRTNSPTPTTPVPPTPNEPTSTPTSTATRTPTPTGPTPTRTATPTVCLTPPDLGGCH